MLFLVLLHKNNWYLQQESNLYLRLRRSPFYPLNYGDMVPQKGLEPLKFRFWIWHVYQFRHRGNVFGGEAGIRTTDKNFYRVIAFVLQNLSFPG